MFEQTLSRFCDAWNRHDAGELASLWSEDGELHHPWGLRRVGRDAIRELLASEHAGTMAESELTVERIEAGPASDTVAVEIDAVLKGVLAPNGRLYDLPTVMSALFVRSGDGWQIRSLAPFANPRHRDA
ncbi:MAG TPA: nuclear transport factor 2 family protein [Thermoanaerobaculia bacterium]|nr:nuclear transport factor 2 family protein [Thermoanaerobaculia bacterium]